MQKFNLHLKILTEPSRAITDMLEDMRLAFEPAGIDFEHMSTERFNLDHLTDLDIGLCQGNSVTAEQQSLYTLRDQAVDNELVVYFVRSTQPFLEGCAAFSDDRFPSAAVIALCSRWALAHEVGHLLGLDHVSTAGSLMHSKPPPVDMVPVLSTDEIEKMQQSPYLHFV